MKINQELSFILSTGRTGTMFFQDYINQTSNAICLHEPKPSRRFIPLTNMYHEEKISSSTFNKIYLKTRKNLRDNIDSKHYIESSNFMWASIPSLNQHFDSINILHIIRHPQDYIKSHYNYGFWKGKKKLIRLYAPYYRVKVEEKVTNDPLLLLALRWKLINKTLSEYQKTNNYLYVKFEDIFKAEKLQQLENLNIIRNFFQLGDISSDIQKKYLDKPINISKRSSNQELENKIQLICEKHLSEEMKFYNYNLK